MYFLIKLVKHILAPGTTDYCKWHPSSVEHIGDFCDPNPVQSFDCVIQSNPNPAVLPKYLIQSGLYPKNPTD